MSYKAVQKPRSTAKFFYPNFLEVDKHANGQPIIIKTGPYKKDLAGETIESVFMYLQHLQEIHNESKNKNKKI